MIYFFIKDGLRKLEEYSNQMAQFGFLEPITTSINADIFYKRRIFIFSMIFAGLNRMPLQIYLVVFLPHHMRQLYGREKIKNQSIILTIKQ
jgi:hypothetical protein